MGKMSLFDVILEEVKPQIKLFEQRCGRIPPFVFHTTQLDQPSLPIVLSKVNEQINRIFAKESKEDFYHYPVFRSSLFAPVPVNKVINTFFCDINITVVKTKNLLDAANGIDIEESIIEPVGAFSYKNRIMPNMMAFSVENIVLEEDFNTPEHIADFITLFEIYMLLAINDEAQCRKPTDYKIIQSDALMILPLHVQKRGEYSGVFGVSTIEGVKINRMNCDNIVMTLTLGIGHAQDRFDKDYNPLNIKTMKLLPNDVIFMSDPILKVLMDCKEEITRESVESAYGEPKKDVAADIEHFNGIIAEQVKEFRYRLFTEVISSNRHYLLFFDDEKPEPIAVLIYFAPQGESIHLDMLYVVPEYRNKGYGTWIMKEFLAEVFLMKDSSQQVVLEIIDAKFKELYPFYSKLGFVPSAVGLRLVMDKKYIHDNLKEIPKIID